MVSESQLHIVAVTGFLHRDGKFLILKRSKKEIANPEQWTIPGGKVERGHTIIETLKKEIKEETNLSVNDDFKFLGDSEFTRPDGYHVVIPRFLCEASKGKVKIDNNDFTDYAWITLNELDKYDLISGVKKNFGRLKDEEY